MIVSDLNLVLNWKPKFSTINSLDFINTFDNGKHSMYYKGNRSSSCLISGTIIIRKRAIFDEIIDICNSELEAKKYEV